MYITCRIGNRMTQIDEEAESMSQKLICLSSIPQADEKYKALLELLRQKYGAPAQILVANEELCELAAVCAKFPRYSNADTAREKLHESVIDEVADVMIILDHVINIFGLTDEEVYERISGKIDRVCRWVLSSSGQEQTTIDREVKMSPCKGCEFQGNFEQLKPGGECFICQGTGSRRKSKEACECRS